MTIGVSRMQQLVRELRPMGAPRTGADGPGRRAMLVAAPGEQHVFGLIIVEDFLRRDGWDVWGGALDDRDAMLGRVEESWFAIVGFSISSNNLLDPLASAISAVRRVSRNRSVGVMVGGRVFLEDPSLVEQVGADVTARDGRLAARSAQEMFEAM